MTARVRTNVVRICFTIVFCWNVLCAFQFLFMPQSFMGAYELSGVPGEAAVRGMGVVFLMWNGTYPAFIAKPQRFRVLGWVIMAQQLIGLMGEAFILFSLPIGHEMLASSIMRFIIFDAAGLVLMVASYAFFKKASA